MYCVFKERIVTYSVTILYKHPAIFRDTFHLKFVESGDLMKDFQQISTFIK